MNKSLFLSFALLSALLTRGQTPTSFSNGVEQYREENYAAALKFFADAGKEEPENAQVPYYTGRIYLDMSDYRKAAAYLEQAIAMDSSRNRWIYECGLVYYAIPDYKKSLRFIELAAEKGYKKTNDYLENLGNAYVNVGQYAKGAAALNEVLQKKPVDKELMYQTAQAYYRAGAYQEAIDHWDRLLELDKTNAEVLYMIGLAFQKKGEKEKGQQLCDRAIEMNPSLKSKRQQLGGGGL